MPTRQPGGDRVRVQVQDLTPRTRQSTDRELDRILKRLGAPEGAPCERDCDCVIGLVCRNSVCVSDW